jgi:hypothetical protein
VPINDDKVRELVARGESTSLDFKTTDYDWSTTAKKDSNAELTKDLMAMANVLRSTSEPAYIITGVTKAIPHTIVGVPPSSHLDDAALHQKVQGRLNQTPQFSYYPVEVNGFSVGVYEILPGGRPYFALRTQSPSLTRHVAAYRNGTSTDDASPTMILQWAREDDPEAQRLRSLEIEKLEAERQRHHADARVHAEFNHMSIDANVDMTATLIVENTGHRGFWLRSCEWRAEWNEMFDENLEKQKATLPNDYISPRGPVPIEYRSLVRPNTKVEIKFKWPRYEALQHLQKIGVAGFVTRWARYFFELRCEGELGTFGTFYHSLQP